MIKGLNKITKASGLGYLMSSYTAHDSLTEAEDEAKQIAADMLRAGLVVFAPIAYGPGVERKMTRGVFGDEAAYYRSHEFWMPICERFFERCEYGIIATTKGWHKSVGIAIELFVLTRAKVPYWFYDVGEEKILTIDEASKKWPDEMEELLRRASDMHATYLNASTPVYVDAIWDTFEEMVDAE